MRNILFRASLMLLLAILTCDVLSQDKVKLYDPALDGMKQINEAVAKAKSQGKHVLIQYGGNWCSWCIRFDAFCKSDSAIMKVINNNYIPVKLNYSPENKNETANTSGQSDEIWISGFHYFRW